MFRYCSSSRNLKFIELISLDSSLDLSSKKIGTFISVIYYVWCSVCPTFSVDDHTPRSTRVWAWTPSGTRRRRQLSLDERLESKMIIIFSCILECSLPSIPSYSQHDISICHRRGIIKNCTLYISNNLRYPSIKATLLLKRNKSPN